MPTERPSMPDNDYKNVRWFGKGVWKPVWRHSVDHRIVYSLTLIIVLCIFLVSGLTGLIIIVDGGVIGDDLLDGNAARNPDEVVTMLAQIASTAVGALAGYFTARVVKSKDRDPFESPFDTTYDEVEPGEEDDGRGHTGDPTGADP